MANTPWEHPMGAIFHDLTGLTKEELCSVCGRPPHPCDDPECVPPTKEIYRRLIHCLAENGFLRADRDAFAEAFYLLWLSSDRDEWDGKAVEHFDALMDKACSYGEAKNKMPNAKAVGLDAAGGQSNTSDGLGRWWKTEKDDDETTT